jgi:hypothetical protein
MLLLWRASLFLCSVHSPDAFSEGLLIRDDIFRLWSIGICSFLTPSRSRQPSLDRSRKSNRRGANFCIFSANRQVSQTPWNGKITVIGGSAMNESEYYAGEFTDDTLDAMAEAGEFYLEESGFYAMPTPEEMQKLARMGAILLLIENHIPIN